MQPPFGLILLDGLDEVPAANERRTLLLQAIRDLLNELPDETRVIITARPYAYNSEHGWRLKDFTELTLQAFDQEQRAQFIEGWYQARNSRFMLQDKELKQRIPDLIERIETQPHLKELAERPLLLTLIAVLHAGGGRLPEDRAQLYKNSVDLLLYHWRRDAFREDGQVLRLDEKALLQCLQKLAFNAHEAQRSLQHDETRGTADISREAILSAFDPLLDLHGRASLLRFLQQHTGILIERAPDIYAFPHRSFQEYLAMGHLNAQHEDELSLHVCTDPLWWREVFLLAVLEQKQIPRNAMRYIRDVLDFCMDKSFDIQNRLFVLAGLALAELGLKEPTKLSDEVRKGLVNIIETPDAMTIRERAEAGRVLSAIGDKRRGVGLDEQGLPDFLWKEISPGKVVLENNAGGFEVEAFYLAAYPVTNAQFQSFIDDPEGFSNPKWWVGLAERFDAPEKPTWTEANHPRETVSWYEAMAFCAWASERLGYTVTLPTEWQWQLAACSGKSEFNYPWGEDYQSGYANINETAGNAGPYYLQCTSAVGLYPQGNSRQEVSDLSGNVWEWCLNEYKKAKNTQSSGTQSRVVRGGSWDDVRGSARASYRSSTPGIRDNGFGFRVCCVSPITSAALCDTEL